MGSRDHLYGKCVRDHENSSARVTTPGVDTPPPPIAESERCGFLDAVIVILDPRDLHGVRYPPGRVTDRRGLRGATSFTAMADCLYDLDEADRSGSGSPGACPPAPSYGGCWPVSTPP
jgi:hypothetical protein